MNQVAAAAMAAWLCGALTMATAAERLDRGTMAALRPDGQAYVGWRLLETDAPGAGFDLYRAEQAEGPWRKITTKAVTGSTNFVDAEAGGRQWHYKVTHAGGEPSTGHAARAVPATDNSVMGLHTIAFEDADAAQKVGIGDLDGDGALDYVVKRPLFNVDPYFRPGYWKKSPYPFTLEAYRHDGTLMWKYDMGWAIETGIWYSPFIVYDVDGDGRAEVYAKAGEGDPRDEDGRVMTGPEYLVKIDGLTGKVVQKVDWPDRSGFDTYANPLQNYNYWSRNMIGVAYLDGKRPHLIVERGTYTIIKLRAYKPDLSLAWSRDLTNRLYMGAGTHGMQVADIDSDGRDELVIGAAAIDDDGKPMWSTGFGHPDVCHVADIDPDRPGLEIFYGQEWPRSYSGVSLADARTGHLIWSYDGPTTHVHGQGMVADLDPARPGLECYAGEKDGSNYWLYDAKGSRLSDQPIEKDLSPRAVYWNDGPIKLIASRGKLFGLDGKQAGTFRGSIIAIADVLGDWREEVIATESGKLLIYTSTVEAASRRMCLLRDRQYRTATAIQAMGYLYPPQLGGKLIE